VDRSRNRIPDITWFDEKGREMQWGKADRLLAYRLDGSRAEIAADRDDNEFFLMFSALEQDREFVLCEPPAGKSWHLSMDTGLPSPEDFLIPGRERLLPVQNRYTVRARSVVVLLAR
jgi:glycogen operon protein